MIPAKEQRSKTTRAWAGLALLLAVWLGVPGVQAREPNALPKVEAQHIETKPLAGDPGKEFVLKADANVAYRDVDEVIVHNGHQNARLVSHERHGE